MFFCRPFKIRSASPILGPQLSPTPRTPTGGQFSHSIISPIHLPPWNQTALLPGTTVLQRLSGNPQNAKFPSAQAFPECRDCDGPIQAARKDEIAPTSLQTASPSPFSRFPHPPVVFQPLATHTPFTILDRDSRARLAPTSSIP